MLQVVVRDDVVHIGRHFKVSFQRTLRIPDDGKPYPLPPGLGRFPVGRVEDYPDLAPAAWREQGGVFIPLHQREALWLAFEGADWRPNAVQVAVGGVNALSGESWGGELKTTPQNYLVCPDQPWLDGIHVGEGMIRQFVAVPLGQGYTVEAQLTGKEDVGGIQIRVFEPKPGRFPDRPPAAKKRPDEVMRLSEVGPAGMGFGAGGQMRQKVYPDAYGVDAWDAGNTGSVFVHIVNSQVYAAITGREPPPSPIDADTYTRHGFPWFELYDEHLGDVPVSQELAGVKSVQQVDIEKGLGAPDESVHIQEDQVKKLPPRQSPAADD